MIEDFDNDGYGEPENVEQAELAEERHRVWQKREHAERMKRYEEALGHAGNAAVRRDSWHRRWQLSLAVANGAAFVGLSSVVLDPNRQPDAPLLYALVHSAWMFAVGGALAAMIPLARARQYESERLSHYVSAEENYHGMEDVPIWKDEHGHDTESSVTLRSEYQARGRFWRRVVIGSEWAGALGFGAGVLIPLAALTVMTFG